MAPIPVVEGNSTLGHPQLFPKGTKVFDSPGKNVGKTRWGVWAYLVDGARAETHRPPCKAKVKRSTKIAPVDAEESGDAAEEESCLDVFKMRLRVDKES